MDDPAVTAQPEIVEGFRPARVRHGSPWWLWVVALALLGAVVGYQHFSGSSTDPISADKEAKGLGEIEPPRTGALVLLGKLMFAVRQFDPIGTPAAATKPSTPVGGSNSAVVPPASAPAPGPDAAASPSQPEPFRSPWMDMFVQYTNTMAGWEPERVDLFMPARVDKDHPPRPRTPPSPAAERLRATILIAETEPVEEVAWRLDDVEKSLAPESVLHDDVKALRLLYSVPGADGAAPPASGPSALDPVTRGGLESRHGWFAELALSRDDANSLLRSRAADDGVLLLAVFGLFGGIIGLASLAGFVLLIVGLVNASRLKGALIRPDPATEWPIAPGPAVLDQHGWPVPETLLPRRAGAVWLETFCVFLLGFLSLKLITMGLAALIGKPDWLIWVPLTLQWALIGTIFWPVVRGMSWERWRAEIGWHRGRGVGREAAAGFAAYLVTVPIYIVAAIILVLLVALFSWLTGTEPPGPEGNRITEIFGGGSLPEMLALMLLATIWAPIVEESIFRGALFRHLRRRIGLVLAGGLSAAAFAIMHPYPLISLVMISLLGFSFALMREWRGSLIAPAVAHGVHNLFITTMLLTVFSLARV